MIDIGKLSKNRNSVLIYFNTDMLRKCGFEPDTYVQVLYEKDKITIVKEIKKE